MFLSLIVCIKRMLLSQVYDGEDVQRFVDLLDKDEIAEVQQNPRSMLPETPFAPPCALKRRCFSKRSDTPRGLRKLVFACRLTRPMFPRRRLPRCRSRRT